MFEQGSLIAVNGNIYEYGGLENSDYTKNLKLHKVYDVEIDEEGILTATYNSWYFTDQELADGINKIQLTNMQWHGIVEHFIRQNHNLTDIQTKEAAVDIVGRCFVYGVPKLHELPKYIADYLNR